MEKVSGHTGIELSRTPIELKSSVWALKVVPWIGGRIISMEHLPSGNSYVLAHAFVLLIEETPDILFHLRYLIFSKVDALVSLSEIISSSSSCLVLVFLICFCIIICSKWG